MRNISKLGKILKDNRVRGELIKSIGLGVFINSLYGISDGSIELFNIVDMMVGSSGVLIGIVIERSSKWDT